MENETTENVTATLEEDYRARTPRSQELFERARKTMPGGAKGAYFHQPYPLTMARGEGCYLYDVEGQRYVDFANHHTAQVLGHNHPAVIDAIQEQMAKGIALGAPVGIEAELCEEMCQRVTSLDRIRFCNSGTEATLHAIRLARGVSGQVKIAKFEGGYHGSHDVVEISSAPSLDKVGSETAPNPVPSAGGMSPHAAEEVVVLPFNDEASVERLITQHRDELACIIFDTKAGIVPQRKEFVQFVGEVARKNNLLFILDEIVGFSSRDRRVAGILRRYTRLNRLWQGCRWRFRCWCVWWTSGYYGLARWHARQHRFLPERHIQRASYHHGCWSSDIETAHP